MRDMGNERKAPHRFWGRKLLLLLDRALVLVRYSWEMLILGHSLLRRLALCSFGLKPRS